MLREAPGRRSGTAVLPQGACRGAASRSSAPADSGGSLPWQWRARSFDRGACAATSTASAATSTVPSDAVGGPLELPTRTGGGGSLRMEANTSGFGNQAARTSRACWTVLPQTASISAVWLASTKCGFSSATTVNEIAPLPSLSSSKGNCRASRATSIRRQASSSLMASWKRQYANIDE